MQTRPQQARVGYAQVSRRLLRLPLITRSGPVVDPSNRYPSIRYIVRAARVTSEPSVNGYTLLHQTRIRRRDLRHKRKRYTARFILIILYYFYIIYLESLAAEQV